MLQCQSISSHTWVQDYFLLLISIKVLLKEKDDHKLYLFQCRKKISCNFYISPKSIDFSLSYRPAARPLTSQSPGRLPHMEGDTYLHHEANLHHQHTLCLLLCCKFLSKKMLHFALSLSHKSVHYKIIRYLVNIICISKVSQNKR